MTIITANLSTSHNDKSGDTEYRVPTGNKEGYSDLYARGGVLRAGALDRYPELLHAISTRTAPDGDDWNLTAKRGSPEHPPSPETALANREKLAGLLGISLDRVVGCRQIHGNHVERVYERDGGRGMTPDNPSIEGTDAMLTDVPGLYLMALSADCPPVFFYDPIRRVVGLAHSGWKGTVGRIAGNVVEAMVDDFGSHVRDIVAVVGPGIGPCCYSIGENVIEAVEGAFMDAWDGEQAALLEKRDGLVYFNLRETIRRALLEAGVAPENIT
ncbi:MAG: polyphenol oxidase family protein, partial [Chloroflexota bacterium]